MQPLKTETCAVGPTLALAAQNATIPVTIAIGQSSASTAEPGAENLSTAAEPARSSDQEKVHLILERHGQSYCEELGVSFVKRCILVIIKAVINS